MRRFIVASHGPLAASIVESAGLIAGADLYDKWDSICVQMSDSSEEIRARIDSILARYQQSDEIVALTDVLSGNVNNILTEYVSTHGIRLIAGMNLGMVLEAGFSDESEPVDTLCGYLAEAGKLGVRFVNEAMKTFNNEEDEI